MKKVVKTKQITNKNKNSLIKVIVNDDRGKWIKPASNAEYHIDDKATLPKIEFEIDTSQLPPYQWTWAIRWDAKSSGLRESIKRGQLLKTFEETGAFQSGEKKWTAEFGKLIGGRLRVTVQAGSETFKRSVVINGTNPTSTSVKEFLKVLPDCDGLDKLLEQESQFKHFILADSQPVVSFDKGYGLTQMTNPAPSFEQVWSWKENVKAGAALYQQKQRLAKAYLSQQDRFYTSDQLRLETWTRWNGGSYHVWDAVKRLWKRNDDVLCDPSTGNIGWSKTAQENKGKSEAELHERDKDTYSDPTGKKTSSNQWRYTGVCYADHINSQ